MFGRLAADENDTLIGAGSLSDKINRCVASICEPEPPLVVVPDEKHKRCWIGLNPCRKRLVIEVIRTNASEDLLQRGLNGVQFGYLRLSEFSILAITFPGGAKDIAVLFGTHRSNDKSRYGIRKMRIRNTG